MKISSSDILLSSQHAAVEKYSLNESLRVWNANQRLNFERSNTNPNRPHMDPVSISARGRAAHKADATSDALEEANNDPRMLLLISMVESMTGRKIRIMSMRDFQTENAPLPEQSQASKPAAEQTASQPTNFGVEYERHETRYEAEQTHFQAQGVVKTLDGREITFKLELSMSREHLEQSDVSVRLGDAARQTKDPLVINFNSGAVQLTSTKFSFDLDTDGDVEQVSFVAPGSGFLALDKNQDGKINNGSELFGPTSGNGFSELAAYDQDGNHWIDENDAAFDQLKIWSKDALGNDHLASLKEAGVGAIYLDNAATEFSIMSSNATAIGKDAPRHLDGQIRSSGIYLSEDGTAGSVQQIDLVA